MKPHLLLLILFIVQMFLTGCAPFKEIGDAVGEGMGEISDEIGAERRIGEGEEAIVIHPQDDKKVRMSF